MTFPSSTVLLAALLSAPVAVIAQGAAAPVPPAERVLIHVHSADPAVWQASLAKANGIMSSAKPGSAVVEILATGDGLKLIDKDASQSGAVMGSLDKDVSMVACHASMKANHMGIDQLHEGVGTVPSGGREMAMKKAEGWTLVDDAAIK